MDGQMMFRVLLIVAAGIALLAIVMHYNNIMSAEQKRGFDGAVGGFEGFDTQKSYQAPGTPLDSNGPSGAEEEVFDVPAPVMESAVTSSNGASGVLKPSDLLPRLGNTPEEQKFAQLYSTGQGDMQGINFLDAGSQVGLSTRMNRNANLQLRSDPPIPKQPLPFMFSTIEADRLRLPMEIGSHSTAIPASQGAAY